MRCFYGKGETHLCSIPIFYDTKLDFVFCCSVAVGAGQGTGQGAGQGGARRQVIGS